MTTQHPQIQHGEPTVVVGVDGSDDSRSALRYAVTEAAALGVPLDVVHVVPDYLPVSPMVPQTPADLTDTGADILEAVVAEARQLDPDLEIRPQLRHGTRAVQLSQAAEDAILLVVGRDDHPLLERLFRGDVATGVAARAPAPVVQVPAGWEHGSAGVVLVGVKSPQHAAELLGDAFGTARARGARVAVLHAWKLPTVYDDIIEVRVDLESWRQEATREMEMLLRDWRRAYPDVPVEVRVVHDHAGHALVEQSAAADVVLLVRRAHGVPPATHLGSTARTVLRGAHCPVRVVPPTNEPILPLVLESGGELVR